MKLFYSPGASSLAPHIALCEAGIAVQLVRVDLETKLVVATGEPYAAINAMGKVPALGLDSGEVLTETVAVLAYIADISPHGLLAPPVGIFARYKMYEATSFVATELHKGFSSMLDPEVPPAFKKQLLADTRPFPRMAAWVERGPYVLGERFTIADAHLFAVLRMGRNAGLDFDPWPQVGSFMQRVAARPAVRQAIRAEGMIEA
jgi:glutathione S-transferase